MEILPGFHLYAKRMIMRFMLSFFLLAFSTMGRCLPPDTTIQEPCSPIQTDSSYLRSFYNTFNKSDQIYIIDLVSKQKFVSSAIYGDSVDESRFSANVRFPNNQIDTLFKALYNFSITNVRALCYTPQHGIVFYSKGILIAYIEICFKCNQFRIWGDLPKSRPFVNMCDSTKDLLLDILLKN